MKILYTICGDGNGHAFRSSVVIDHLLACGHDVFIVSSGKAYKYLAQRYPQHLEVNGLKLEYSGTRVKKSRTITKNLAKVKSLPQDLRALGEVVKSFRPTVIITDFEPSASVLASFYDLPLICIDNQHIISDTKLPIKRQDYPDYVVTKVYTESVAPNRDYSLITTFFFPPLKKSREGKSWLFPPLIRPEVNAAQPQAGDYFFCYLTADCFDQFGEVLYQTGEKFIIYNAARRDFGPRFQFKEFSPSGVVNDLAGARGVVINGGFTLMSESLYLGKPILSMPIKMQYEQILNARMIEALGLGLMTKELTADVFNSWHSQLSRFTQVVKTLTFSNQLLLSKLDELLTTIR
ncbi:MAG: glycosyltransferase family protein [Candidatus Komeilibacteria bacterium]